MKKLNNSQPFLLNITNQKLFFYFFIFFCFLSIIYFYPFAFNNILIGDDFNFLSQINKFANFKLLTSSGIWLENNNHYFSIMTMPPNLENLFSLLFPPAFSTTFIYLFISFFSILSFYTLFKSFHFSPFISLFAAFMATFSPIYFSYIRTGHIGKLLNTVFFAFAFASLNYLFQASSKKLQLLHSLLIAAFLTLAITSGAYQLTLYFLFLFSAYTLLLIFQHNNSLKSSSFSSFFSNFLKQKQLLLFLLFTVIITFSLSFSTFQTIKKQLNNTSISQSQTTSQSQNSKEITQNQSQNQQWNWATQWSFPKIETIDFFYPGIFGFLSFTNKNPYWGSVGQTPNFLKHQQGLANYSLTSHYLGIFLFIFLLYACFFLPKKITLFWELFPFYFYS